MSAALKKKETGNILTNFISHYFKTRYKLPPAISEALVKDVLKLIDLLATDSIKIGQILILTVSSTEPPGKRLDSCQFVPVKLTVHAPEDIEYCKRYGLKELKMKVIQRITQEAFIQGGSLSESEIANILFVDRRTVVDYIKELKSRGIIIKTRAKLSPQRKASLEKHQIVKMYIEGASEEEVARVTQYPENYIIKCINDFIKVSLLYRQGNKASSITKITNISLPSVNEYIEIYKSLQKEEFSSTFHKILSFFEGPDALQLSKITNIPLKNSNNREKQ